MIKKLTYCFLLLFLVLSHLLVLPKPALALTPDQVKGCSFQFETSKEPWDFSGVKAGQEYLFVHVTKGCGAFDKDARLPWIKDVKYRFAVNGQGPGFIHVNSSDLEKSTGDTVTALANQSVDAISREGTRITITKTGTARNFFKVNPPASSATKDNTTESQASQEAASGDQTNDDTDNSCETKGGALGWILCPVILATDGALNWVDSRIQEVLDIDKGYYDNPGIKRASTNIRNVAYIILVPIALVMVIGTALEFEIISAYTVKKALPRLFAAVIFITLAYPICVYLIELFNVVGRGTLGLLTAPFDNDVSRLTLSSLFGGSIFTSIIAAPAFAVGIAIIIWLFGGTLLLFAATAFLVLLLRQIFIVGFLLVAPLAILSWIFPNNDRLWKLWWNSFTKLLMMFPLIMGVIALGRIFAFIIHSSNPAGLDGAVLAPLMTLAAYMIPYAFIPFTFRLAGGLFATLTGIVNDRQKGLFDRQRQSRAAKLERTANQKMFKGAGDRGLRHSLNTGAAAVMHARRAGLNPLLWQSRLDAALSENSIMQRDAMMEDKEYTWKGDDDLNRAAATSTDAASMRRILTSDTRLRQRYMDANGNWLAHGQENLERDVAKAENLRRKYGDSAFRQATFLQAVAGGTTYGNDELHPERAAEVWQAAAAVAGNDNGILAELVAKGRSAAMQAGRVDQGGAGFGDTFAIAQRLRDNPNYTVAQATSDLTARVLEGQSAGTLAHASMKPQAIRALVPQMRERIEAAALHAQQTGDQSAYERELAVFANTYDAMSSSAPQLARILADQVMGWSPGVPLNPGEQPLPAGTAGPVAPTQTIQEALRERRNNPAFTQMRREYSEQEQYRRGGQPPPPGPEAGATPPIGGGPT